MKCLLIQPIHPRGMDILRNAGIEAVSASSTDMQVVAREIADADAVITRNAGLSRGAIEAGAQLKVVGNHGIGLDPVDVAYATSIGLPVVFTPYANVRSVAELAMTQMLALAKRVCQCDAATREGRFDYRYSREFHEVSGKTLLIVGFGRIGRLTAEMAHAAFGMKILVHSPSVPAEEIAAAGFVSAPVLEEALGQADIVSLHQVLNDRTRGMFDAARLAALKPGAILVNTARGALVDGAALIAAVRSGHLSGAAMDVFDKEPLPVDSPFVNEPGLLLSPHTGGATEEAMERTASQVASQVVDVLNGRRPEYLVNPQVWRGD
ncbi:MAG: hydroxyacid dehydrogenase [Gluconacetobacter liquefaciens]